MGKTGMQSAFVGLIAGAGALWVRYGLHWWPSTPLDKGAYWVTCPACPVDVAAHAPALHESIGFVLVNALIYAMLGIGIETARRMRHWRPGH